MDCLDNKSPSFPGGAYLFYGKACKILKTRCWISSPTFETLVTYSPLTIQALIFNEGTSIGIENTLDSTTIQQANKMEFATIQQIAKDILNRLNGLTVTSAKFTLQQAIAMVEGLSNVACCSASGTSNHHN